MAKSLKDQRGAGLQLGWCLFLAILLLVCRGCTQAHAYSDESIVKAIYHAEGGHKAKYAYGIRSVKYGTIKEAKRICLRTVRNNRRRWKAAGRKNDFLSFLAAKYCPLEAKNDPRGLNRNWLKNVRFHLAKGTKRGGR